MVWYTPGFLSAIERQQALLKENKQESKWQKGLMLAVVLAAAALFLYSFLGGTRKKTEPITRSAFAFDTFITITLYDTENTAILDRCEELCRYYENMLSKTKEGSDIYRINHRSPEERVIEVSTETAELIEKGLYYSRLSDGAFDITIAPLSDLWKFTDGKKQIPQEAAIKEAVKKVGYEAVTVTGNQIELEDGQVQLDLGAIAKGYIADRIKEYLTGQGVKSAVINLGGNVLCLGEQVSGEPFRIGLRKPFGDQYEQAAVLEIRDQSVVSSGVYERNFIKDGVNYHHILNPRDGYPYQNGLTDVTIVSPLSVDGDGLSTTCFSLGLEKGMELIDSLEGIYAFFITEDEEIHYSEGAKDLLAK